MGEKITLKSIEEKLGFDPLHPVFGKEYEHENDNLKSPYAPLTNEELAFLLDYKMKAAGLDY